MFPSSAWRSRLCRTGTSFRHWEKEPMESMNSLLSFSLFNTLTAPLVVLKHRCPLENFSAMKLDMMSQLIYLVTNIFYVSLWVKASNVNHVSKQNQVGWLLSERWTMSPGLQNLSRGVCGSGGRVVACHLEHWLVESSPLPVICRSVLVKTLKSKLCVRSTA